MTQHELSAIAPNVQWVQLFASLGFAARLRRHPSRRHHCPPTSSSRLCTRAHTCTHARMHEATSDNPSTVAASDLPAIFSNVHWT